MKIRDFLDIATNMSTKMKTTSDNSVSSSIYLQYTSYIDSKYLFNQDENFANKKIQQYLKAND